MKPTQRKDALRNIGRQKISYLSIVIIALMGVTMFLGMNYGAAAIQQNGSTFYNDVNYRDVEVVSTRLLSAEDMRILRDLEGVLDAEGVQMTSAKVSSGSDRADVTVITATQRMNQPTVFEGRLPAEKTECAVERSLARQMGWKTGDRIKITNGEGQTAQFLTDTEFLITGVILHPDHACDSVPDTPYVLVCPEAFDLDIFQGCFMKAELLVDAPREKGRFSAAYQDATALVQGRVDAISKDRAALRQQEVDEQIAKAAEDRLTLDWDRLEEAKEKFRNTIRSKITEKVGAEAMASVTWAAKLGADLTNPATSAMTLQLTDTLSANLHLSLRENVNALIQFPQIPEDMLRLAFVYMGGQGEYSAEAVRAQIVDEVMPALEPYEDEYQALVDACTTWDEAYAKYLDGTLWEEIGLPGMCRWIVTDVNGNMSFVQLSSSGDSLSRLQMTFSLLFVAVGALVVYVTVSKMIDEQRSLVGATKALGFYRREIFSKYLTFGASATMLGILAGVLLARFGVLPFVLNGYQIYYNIDITRGTMTVLPTLIAFAAALLLSVSAVWFACRRLLKTPAVVLLQTAMPKGRKTASKEPSRLPLYSRLILRNIRSDLRRVIVTIVSVAGCCSLVVVGFTLRHAVNGAVDHQFGEIVNYDAMYRFDPAVNPEAAQSMDAELKQIGAETLFLQDVYCTVQVRNLDVEELLCGDMNAMAQMFRLYDADTGRPMVPSNEGVFIPKRFSEYYGVAPGDVLEITINATDTVYAPVAGVFNNYMNRIFFLSEGCFESLYGRAPVHNACMARLNGGDVQTVDRLFSAIDGYGGCTPADSFRQLFQSATSVMNAVVALFIFMAAVMAGVVLMNLTNIYILQKKRELTVMRINGFTTRETIQYVLRETVVTTILGILLGVGLGAGLGYAITRALEPPLIQFDRSVSVVAWLVAVVLTVFFTVVVNAVALRKVKHLKFTDVS